MIQTASTLQTRRAVVPQERPDFVRRSSVWLRAMDQRRAGFALGVTFRLAGLTGKRAASVLEVHESTISRHTDGEHDTPHSRVRELYRKLTKGGAYPGPLLADLFADAWRESYAMKSRDELMERKRELHCEETRQDARVDIWQADDLAGESVEDEAAVDEAILGQIARLLELYTVRQEIKNRTDSL